MPINSAIYNVVSLVPQRRGGGGGWGWGCRGVFVGFRGGGVPPSSPNPDLFSQ